MLKHEMKLAILFSIILGLSTASTLFAHCDTLNGPVIADARRALETSDVKPVLKWIKQEYQSEIKSTFEKVLQSKSLTSDIQSELQHRFLDVIDQKKRKDQSVEDGREYIEAYVRFVHYVEALHQSSELQREHSD